MGSRVRKAGARWRLLVHDVVGRGYGTSRHIHNADEVPRPLGDSDEEYAAFRAAVIARREAAIRDGSATYTELPGAEFDELVVHSWLHVEQMDNHRWWMNVGGVTLWVRADRDGRPKRVDVYGPGDYAEPEKGCQYGLSWSADSDPDGSAPSTPGGGEQ